MNRDSWILLVSDHAGIYIPQYFEELFRDSMNPDDQVSLYDDLDILQNPDHPKYWDAWNEVLNCQIISENGTIYNLHQDGDLWGVPAGYDWDSELD